MWLFLHYTLFSALHIQRDTHSCCRCCIQRDYVSLILVLRRLFLSLFLNYPAHSLVLESSVLPFCTTAWLCSRLRTFDCAASTVGSPSLDISAPAPAPPASLPTFTSISGIGSPSSVNAVCSVLGIDCCPP